MSVRIIRTGVYLTRRWGMGEGMETIGWSSPVFQCLYSFLSPSRIRKKTLKHNLGDRHLWPHSTDEETMVWWGQVLRGVESFNPELGLFSKALAPSSSSALLKLARAKDLFLFPPVCGRMKLTKCKKQGQRDGSAVRVLTAFAEDSQGG